MLAGRPGWDAVAVNYGALPDDLAALDGACPVVASYGGRDRYLRGAASTGSRRRWPSGGSPHDVKEYPDAGHAFLNDEDNAPWYLAPMSRLVMHAGPEPACGGGRLGADRGVPRAAPHQVTAPRSRHSSSRPVGSSTAPPRFHSAR